MALHPPPALLLPHPPTHTPKPFTPEKPLLLAAARGAEVPHQGPGLTQLHPCLEALQMLQESICQMHPLLQMGLQLPPPTLLRIIQLMYHVSGHSLGARTGCLGLIPHKSPASAIPKRGIEPTPASRPAQLPLHAHAPVPARTSLRGLLLHGCCSQQD